MMLVWIEYMKEKGDGQEVKANTSIPASSA